MTYTKDVYKVSYQDVVAAAQELLGFDVWRKPDYYILLCDALSSSGDARKFADNPHGYTEAIAWLEEIDRQGKKEEIDTDRALLWLDSIINALKERWTHPWSEAETSTMHMLQGIRSEMAQVRKAGKV